MKHRLILVLTYIGSFILAAIVGIYTAPFYRWSIIRLFKWLQGDSLDFYGKNLFLFVNPYYVFGMGLLSCWLLFFIKKEKSVIKNLFTFLVLFPLATVLVSYCVSFAKIITCTTCNGRLPLSYNEVPYSSVFIFSALIALLPITVSYFRNLQTRHRKIP